MLILYLGILETEEEKDKFEQLYYKYRGIVYYIAFKYMAHNNLAEDAVQETFIKLMKYLDKMGDVDEHKTYSFVKIVTKSVCMDILRKEKSHKVKDAFLSDQIETSDFKSEHCEISEIISSLPQIYKDVLMLKFYYNLSAKEISQTLNISKSGVYRIIKKAAKLIKEEIS